MRFFAKMGYTVSLIISSEASRFYSLPQLYEQVKRAVTHKIFYSDRALIFAENIANYDRKYYVYPAKEEEWMKHAVMRGNPEKSQGHHARDAAGLGQILAHGWSTWSSTGLAIAFLDIIDELQKGGFLGFPIEVPNSVLGAPNLAKFDSIDEIVAIFFRYGRRDRRIPGGQARRPAYADPRRRQKLPDGKFPAQRLLHGQRCRSGGHVAGLCRQAV